MAKVKDNVLAKGFSGTIGRTLTFRQLGGETFVSKYQRAPTVAATEKKLAVQTKFGTATAYARRAIKDPEMKAMYQAFVKGGQRAFNIAMMDALRAPEVESIQADSCHGRVGDQIIIRAMDDFKVIGVVVAVYNKAGDLLEQGNAVAREDEKMDWLYRARQENPEYSGSKITAVATDLPGNCGSLNLNLP
jgi:hypothetical protein